MSTYAYSAPATAPHKPILSERFKTKQCAKFAVDGHCPYVHRCMFAHGEHDLRTAEENIRDGLVTDEAIKAYQRVLRLRQEMQEAEPAYVSAENLSVVSAVRYSHNPYSVTHPYTYFYDEVKSTDSEGATSEDGSSVDRNFTHGH